MPAPYRVLFLCTANSARSIMAEALLGVLGQGRFEAFSAGSHPGGMVQPLAEEIARELGHQGALRSKSWDEFSQAGAVPIDAVITVCDNAAGEACPVWPGHPVRAHWGVPDPAAATGPEAQRRKAFQSVCSLLQRHVEQLLALPLERMEPGDVQRELNAIGRSLHAHER
jgi:arsenate reductase